MRFTSTKHAGLALTLALAGLTGSCGSATAQMELPGAVAPTPEGTNVPASPTAAKPKPRVRTDGAPADPAAAAKASAAPAKVPAALSLAGQALYLNGRKSQIAFEARDNALSIVRLTLFGQKLSNSRDECQVLPQATPIATTDLGRPNGLVRFKLNLPACPITFDVLDGAALAVGDPPTCDFPDADCKITADGLWGPQPGALGPPQVKTTEKARASAEKGGARRLSPAGQPHQRSADHYGLRPRAGRVHLGPRRNLPRLFGREPAQLLRCKTDRSPGRGAEGEDRCRSRGAAVAQGGEEAEVKLCEAAVRLS